ncbi:phosphoribosyltransferase [Jannaschia seohaensis]|uniref:Phosphoribosyl transferase domain-containing protein n=1 Tax=Jannaschia seohaensis TaxID=475081 RepID=A0A2Y9A3H9_9RHOB|nr:phosphoribosyltransferase [Jannaschia seohaensis]PWJ22128.1 phosphoribosyl transferase-like protein [Jannaschia seohaensis]SSA38406.1 Phosphoribosyl transferase domain-containing protein [Jannaschia seohaensis]
MQPHEFWQVLLPPGPTGAEGDRYAAALPDGRRILCPIRVLPGGCDRAVASLIVNQASFAVFDALAESVAQALRPDAPDVIVGIPTLGLPLAEAVARRLDHARMLPLGTSRKFWYDPDLSEPMRSITSPDQEKRLYLDPRLLPLLDGARVALVDDVISTGGSMRAALRLLAKAGVTPVALGVAMRQGTPETDLPLRTAFATPRLTRSPDGWRPA